MKVKGHPYGPPADMDPETAICMRKIFEALEDARLRLDSDTSNLEHLRAAKQKERNELMKSGVTVYDGPFEVDEAMLLRPEFVVRHLLTTADIPEPETIDTTTKKKKMTKKKKEILTFPGSIDKENGTRTAK